MENGQYVFYIGANDSAAPFKLALILLKYKLEDAT